MPRMPNHAMSLSSRRVHFAPISATSTDRSNHHEQHERERERQPAVIDVDSRQDGAQREHHARR